MLEMLGIQNISSVMIPIRNLNAGRADVALQAVKDLGIEHLVPGLEFMDFTYLCEIPKFMQVMK